MRIARLGNVPYDVAMSAATPPHEFVSRAGLKLEHALREFEFDIRGRVCADFGCNVGGFTDCLLQRGAARVYAVDTGYGTLAYKLRIDPRVVVMERTNALHAARPDELINLVVIDLAWTPQRYAVPAAVTWLRPKDASRHDASEGVSGRLISLVKPHYELSEEEKREQLINGRLDPREAERVLERVLGQMPQWGVQPERWTTSPITGGKSSRKAGQSPLKPGVVGPGNVEFLVLARLSPNGPAATATPAENSRIG